ERLGGADGGVCEIGDVAQPLAYGPQALLGVGLEAFRVFDERVQLREAGLSVRRVAGQLVVAAAGRLELAPGAAELDTAALLLLADEGIEHVELVGRPGEATLLELARHRDQALGRGREVLPRDGAAPGVGARPAVGEDPAREREARLVLGLKLGERLHALLVEEALWQVELGLDVRLAAAGPDVGRVAFRAE